MKIKTSDILPETIYTNDVLVSSLLGAGLGSAAGWFFNRKRRRKTKIKKAIIGALYGGMVGAGTNIVWQKIKEQLGGRYVGQRQALPDLNKHKEINVYINGAEPGELKFRQDRTKYDNTAFFGWDETTDAVDYIKSLPSDIKVNVLGHSYGGDTAYDIATKVKDRLNSVRLLDPIGTRGILSNVIGMPIKKPYENIKKYVVELAGNIGERTDAQKKSNLYALIGGRYNKDKIRGADLLVHPTDSHKLESTSHRL